MYVYLREFNSDGVVSVSLLFGRSSAVLATQAVMMIRRELDVEIDEEIYFSDSKVVLGYI